MSAQRNPQSAAALETPGYGAYRSLWVDALYRLARNRLALAGGVIILLMVVVAILAPLIAPFDPNEQNYDAILRPPGASHLMGTDNLGRDTFSRLIYGARISLAVGIFTQAIILLIGLPVGAIAGFAGGRIRSRVADIHVMHAYRVAVGQKRPADIEPAKLWGAWERVLEGYID